MAFNRPIPATKPRPESRPGPRPGPRNGLAALVEAEKMVQIAILLPCSAFVGWLAGAWLDSLLHQTWIALAGIIFGGFAGLFYVVRLVIAAGGNAKSAGQSATAKTEVTKPSHD